MSHNREESQLNFRSDDLAVPEVVTGILDECEELADDGAEEAIVYDDLAVPEIHVQAVLDKEQRK